MTRGISESKQGEVNARKDAVLAYLKKHGPSSGPSIVEHLDASRGQVANALDGLRAEGAVEMRGVKNNARYGLAGDERWAVRGEQVRHAPKPVVDSVAKIAANAVYGTDDPVAVLRVMRAKILHDANVKAEKLDVKADTSMMSRFFRRQGITLKKRRSSHVSRTART